MQGNEEQPSLAEVKDVLRKLQRLDFLEKADGGNLHIRPAPSQDGSAKGGALPRTYISVFDRKHAAVALVSRRARPVRRIASYLSGVLALIISAGAIFIGAGVLKVPGIFKNPPGESATRQETKMPLITDARGILNSGEVVSARSILLQIGPDARANVAFMLAQSYDPNYLQTLPKADGLPDRSEARRWYEKWHELAVKSGLEMDSERLQRIIKSMN